MLIAAVDGLKGFPEAITAAFPQAMVQTVIVHRVRCSLNFCAWKDRKSVAADLRQIYQAPTADHAAVAIVAFEAAWGNKYASIAPGWRRAWDEVTPFIAFPPAVRKIIYITNAIESLNRVIRKLIKTRRSYSTEEAATRLIYLAIRNFEKGGKNAWDTACSAQSIRYHVRSALQRVTVAEPRMGHNLPIKGKPSIFVIGDTSAVFIFHGVFMLGTAPAAKQHGSYLAEAIRAR